MKLRFPMLAVLLGLFFPLAAGCGQNHSSGNGTNSPEYRRRGLIILNEKFNGQHPLKVVCTTGMVADLVRRVGGDRVQVTQLMGEDVDPHLYKATPGDVIQLQQADLIFYSGLHLEGKMADIFEQMSRERPTFPVAEYLEDKQVLHADEALDPHVWFDVSLWNQAREVVEEVLTKFDPQHADEYRQRSAAFRKELDELHHWTKEQIATIPKTHRVLITAHDAFRYFGKVYDIEVKGIQGISTESEASLRHINELVAFITERKIKAVFVETSVSERNMKALLEGCRARGHEVRVGGTLFSDAMGKEGTPEGTYVGMVRHNVNTIVKALK